MVEQPKSPFQPAFDNVEFRNHVNTAFGNAQRVPANWHDDNFQCKAINKLMENFMITPFGVGIGHTNYSDIHKILETLIAKYTNSEGNIAYTLARGLNIIDMIKDMVAGGMSTDAAAAAAAKACPLPPLESLYHKPAPTQTGDAPPLHSLLPTNHPYDDSVYGPGSNCVVKMKQGIKKLFTILINKGIMHLQEWTSHVKEFKQKAHYYLYDCGPTFNDPNDHYPVLKKPGVGPTDPNGMAERIFNWANKIDTAPSGPFHALITSRFELNNSTVYTYKLNLFLGWIGCMVELPKATIYNGLKERQRKKMGDWKQKCDAKTKFYVSDDNSKPVARNSNNLFELAVGNNQKQSYKPDLLAKGNGDGTVAAGLVTESYTNVTETVAGITCDTVLAFKWILFTNIFNIKNAATIYRSQDCDQNIYVYDSDIDYQTLADKEKETLNSGYDEQIQQLVTIRDHRFRGEVGAINIGRQAGRTTRLIIDDYIISLLNEGIVNLNTLKTEYQSLEPEIVGGDSEYKKLYMDLTCYKLTPLFMEQNLGSNTGMMWVVSKNKKYFCLAQKENPAVLGIGALSPTPFFGASSLTSIENLLRVGAHGNVGPRFAFGPDNGPSRVATFIQGDLGGGGKASKPPLRRRGRVSPRRISKTNRTRQRVRVNTGGSTRTRASVGVFNHYQNLLTRDLDTLIKNSLDTSMLVEINDNDTQCSSSMGSDSTDPASMGPASTGPASMGPASTGSASMGSDSTDPDPDSDFDSDFDSEESESESESESETFDYYEKQYILQKKLYTHFVNYFISENLNREKWTAMIDMAIDEGLVGAVNGVHDGVYSLYNESCLYFHIKPDYSPENTKLIVDEILENFYSDFKYPDPDTNTKKAEEEAAEAEPTETQKTKKRGRGKEGEGEGPGNKPDEAASVRKKLKTQTLGQSLTDRAAVEARTATSNIEDELWGTPANADYIENAIEKAIAEVPDNKRKRVEAASAITPKTRRLGRTLTDGKNTSVADFERARGGSKSKKIKRKSIKRKKRIKKHRRTRNKKVKRRTNKKKTRKYKKQKKHKRSRKH